MSATSVWDAPSGECLRGRGRYGESLQVTLYDPYLSASEVVFHKRGAISSVLPLPFTFTDCSLREDARKRPGGIVLIMSWKVLACPKRMRSPEINGEGELRGQPANPGSRGRMAVKTEYVCVMY